MSDQAPTKEWIPSPKRYFLNAPKEEPGTCFVKNDDYADLWRRYEALRRERNAAASVAGCALTELHQKVTAPEPPAEWQPIETAPKKYTPILLKQDETIGEGWHASQLDIWEFANPQHVMRRRPTHWMPLPVRAAQPPRDGQ